MSPACVSAQQETFPFLGTVQADKIHIRAGESVNFESLGLLRENQEVLVQDHNYSWYRIQLPNSSESYISKKYVSTSSGGIGEVTAKDVNVRARPDINSSILSQAGKGDKLLIREDLEDWYKIEPLKESSGWVHEKFIGFKSRDISGYAPRELSSALKTVKKQEMQEAKEKELARQKDQELKERQARTVTLDGVISLNITSSGESLFAVTEEGKALPAYYLHDANHILEKFNGQFVNLTGIISQPAGGQRLFSSLDILRIKLYY